MSEIYTGLIILVCGFALGDIAGFNRQVIRLKEQRRRGGRE